MAKPYTGTPTNIPYADWAWNPITGCTPKSRGCENCWAQKMLGRNLPGMGHDPDGPDVQCHPERLDAPDAWHKPRIVATCLMGDLFHESLRISYDFLKRLFRTMGYHYQHTFLVLTKRPEQAAIFLSQPSSLQFNNIWLGATVEDQDAADERLPILADIDWPNKWVSVEPMLGPITLGDMDVPEWVVVGCESGSNARAFDEEWVRALKMEIDERPEIRDFYYKQAPNPARRGSVIENPELDGRQWTEVPWDE